MLGFAASAAESIAAKSSCETRTTKVRIRTISIHAVFGLKNFFVSTVTQASTCTESFWTTSGCCAATFLDSAGSAVMS